MVTLRLSRLQTALAASGIVAQLKSPRLVDCPLPPTSVTVTPVHVPGPVRGKVPAATLFNGKPGPVPVMLKGVSPAVMVTLRLSRLQTALAVSGVVGTPSSISKPHDTNVPLSNVIQSVTVSVQLPLAFWPSNALKACWGVYEAPVGGSAFSTGPPADSSFSRVVMLSPLNPWHPCGTGKPTRSTKVTVVAPCVRVITRSPTHVWVMLSSTSTSAIVKLSGTVMVLVADVPGAPAAQVKSRPGGIATLGLAV